MVCAATVLKYQEILHVQEGLSPFRSILTLQSGQDILDIHDTYIKIVHCHCKQRNFPPLNDDNKEIEKRKNCPE